MFVAACAVCTSHHDVLTCLSSLSCLTCLLHVLCARVVMMMMMMMVVHGEIQRGICLVFIFLKTYHCVYFYTWLFLDTWTVHPLVIMAESKGQRGQSSGSTSGPSQLLALLKNTQHGKMIDSSTPRTLNNLWLDKPAKVWKQLRKLLILALFILCQYELSSNTFPTAFTLTHHHLRLLYRIRPVNSRVSCEQ